MTGFKLIPEWASSVSGPDEWRETASHLKILVSDKVATFHEDDWSKTVKDGIYVEAYPLAFWLAANWWRLLYETASDSTKNTISWKMAHCLPAAGHGIIWPDLVIDSDGVRIEVKCTPNRPSEIEPVRYLNEFQQSLEIEEFRQGITQFIELVIARLDSRSITDTRLHALWKDVSLELTDPEAMQYRRLEAESGYDPDEAPENIINTLLSLASRVGAGAVDEIAPLCSGPSPLQVIESVEELSQQKGLQGEIQFHDAPTPGECFSFPGTGNEMPWDTGYRLARQLRKLQDIKSDGISDDTLAGILSLTKHQLLADSGNSPTRQPLGLAVRKEGGNRISLFFQKNSAHGRRFEAARIIADHFCARVGELWLPVTSVKTMRQKVQRAFAAEFLCPIEPLREYLGGNYTDEDSWAEASEHFGISSVAIEYQLRNNNLIP